jgi:hypothetical protein
VRRIILDIVSEPANKEKPGFSQRTLTTSRNLLCSFRSYREIKESTDKWSQKENQRSIRRESSSSAASILGLQKQHLRSPEAASSVSRSRYDSVSFAFSFQKVIMCCKNTV